MPFLRFSRDKRGYENTYLVHTQSRRGKPSRPRVLYWYRTPPGIKVGRPPFDEEVRRRLEAQNPDVSFNWPSIIATPFPPPAENELWRERRRAERAAKQAQRASDEAVASAVPSDAPTDDGDVAPSDPEWLPEISDVDEQSAAEVSPQVSVEPVQPRAEVRTVEASPSTGQRRRRRGGRHHRSRGPENGGLTPTAAPVEPTSAESGESFHPSDRVDLPESRDE